MKKSILSLLFLSVFTGAIAQNKTQAIRQGTRNLETPQVLALLNDTASKIGVISHDNNIDAVVFGYSIFTAQNKQIGATATFVCKGSCYTYYQNNLGKNIPFQIVADSALHVDIIQP